MGRRADLALLLILRRQRTVRRGRKDLVILQKKVAGLSGDALDRFVLRARKAVGLRGR